MCDRIISEILMIVAALGLVAAGEHHPVNVPAAERGRNRCAGRSTLLSGRCTPIRRRGSDGGLPKSPPITTGPSAHATGCTLLFTKTADCRWGSPGHADSWGWARGLVTIVCSVTPGRSPGRRSSAWATGARHAIAL